MLSGCRVAELPTNHRSRCIRDGTTAAQQTRTNVLCVAPGRLVRQAVVFGPGSSRRGKRSDISREASTAPEPSAVATIERPLPHSGDRRWTSGSARPFSSARLSCRASPSPWPSSTRHWRAGRGARTRARETVQSVVTRLTSLSCVSAVIPFPPVAVAAAGLAVGVGAARGWPAVRARPRFERPLPRTTPGIVIVATVLGCLYTVVAGTRAAVIARPSVSAGLYSSRSPPTALPSGRWFERSKAESRISGPRTVVDGGLLGHTESQVASTVRRLARLADVLEPSVRVVGSEQPGSMTAGDGNDVLLVSSGLVGALPEAELEAALAREVGHLASDNSRVICRPSDRCWRPTSGSGRSRPRRPVLGPGVQITEAVRTVRCRGTVPRARERNRRRGGRTDRVAGGTRERPRTADRGAGQTRDRHPGVRALGRSYGHSAAGARRRDRVVRDPFAGRDTGRTSRIDDRIRRDGAVSPALR